MTEAPIVSFGRSQRGSLAPPPNPVIPSESRNLRGESALSPVWTMSGIYS